MKSRILLESYIRSLLMESKSSDLPIDSHSAVFDITSPGIDPKTRFVLFKVSFHDPEDLKSSLKQEHLFTYYVFRGLTKNQHRISVNNVIADIASNANTEVKDLIQVHKDKYIPIKIEVEGTSTTERDIIDLLKKSAIDDGALNLNNRSKLNRKTFRRISAQTVLIPHNITLKLSDGFYILKSYENHPVFKQRGLLDKKSLIHIPSSNQNYIKLKPSSNASPYEIIKGLDEIEIKD